jgi:enoyl-CoA hydratase
MAYRDYDTLRLEQVDKVLIVTVNRPEVLNAQSRHMREELDEALARAAEDESVRAIIIAGAGEHFSAGHDIGSPQERADQAKRPYAPGARGRYNRAWDLNVANTLRWRDIPKPTIAQVQGYCIMGGLILATACDLIIASDDAKFSDRAIRWGLPHVQYFSLPWEVGVRKAKEYIFTGDWITADEALSLGLVNRVVPRARLAEETLALAERIAMNDPYALRLAKASLNLVQDQMGFRNGILASFANFVAAPAEAGNGPRGIERARLRDAAFGDNPSSAKLKDRPAKTE